MDERFEEILKKALRNRCTDIHFSQNEDGLTINMRTINGYAKIESCIQDIKLFNYLQYQARLDVTSKHPQSGSFCYFYKGVYYDFRLSLINSGNIKDGVLRILNCHKGLSLQQLTWQKDVHEKFLQFINLRSGLIIFSGLTGNGKTTTIYSLLQMMNNRSIYSLEDPIEVVQPNIVQLEINQKSGFGYDEGIKQIMRHNPDVMMIGEIRDETTAAMAVRAGLTGTLVFTSLHASSCSNAVNRMLDLKVNKNDLSACCVAMINQRLLRKADGKGYTCLYEIIENEQISQVCEGKFIQSNMAVIIKKAVENGVIDKKYDNISMASSF